MAGEFPNEWGRHGASLAPSAAPFVPNSTGLTPSASEFQPGRYTSQQHQQQAGHQGDAYLQAGPGGATQAAYASVQGGAQYYHQQPEEYFNAQEQVIDAPRLIPRTCKPLPTRRTLGNSKLLPDDLRAYYAHQAKLYLDQLPPDNPRVNEVPREFHSVLPLDDRSKKTGRAGSSGYPTSVYKAVGMNDGYVYCLRRIDNVRRGLQLVCRSTLQAWNNVQHPNIIPLRNAFERKGALFVMHDYFPAAQSLHDYIQARGTGNLLPESSVWSISLQVLLGIRHVHNRGMACRCINPARVLICGRQRVRLGSVGLMDILESDSTMSIQDHQQEDLANLGRLVLVLSCMSMQAYQDVESSLEFIKTNLSIRLADFVTMLIRRPCNLSSVLAQCSEQMAEHMTDLYQHSDAVEERLSNQFESERLNRLLMKLGLVNERPEYGKAWSETGDRYILALFRDYVFHQTDDNGKPWIDLGHIIDSLNKLDIGSSEKILLTSRDSRSILVVTFAEVRKCLEQAFLEILPAQMRPKMYY